jgi:alkaline phosphatase D
VRGTELVGTSISSSFEPTLADVAEQLIAALPHVRWADTRHRGYTRCDVDRHQLVARFQQVASVLQPESPVSTGTTWTVEAGVLGAQEG